MTVPSIMQKSFDDVYDEFLFACSHGDYLSVEHLLQNGNISYTDISTTKDDEKFSPIVIAIEHNHLEVIKILLDRLPYNEFREALLLAIYLDLTKIAQFIMEHDTFKCFYGTFADWQTDSVQTYDESHFASIRPIQLAAQYNRTTILYNFLKKVPHNIECTCNECKSAGLSDSLRHSQLRLSAYRGLSSDVYLALVSKDPITKAFALSNDLSILIINEPHFRSEYSYLRNQISHFTANLLDHIRNQIELEVLLTNERLDSAIEHNQYEFITHTTTQQRLTDLWYQNIDLVRYDTLRKRILASIYYFIIYIPMYIAYFWLPFHFEHRCRWYFKQAAIQALMHTITYDIFLLMLIFSSILKSYETLLDDQYSNISSYYHRLLSMDKRTLYCKETIVTSLEIFLLIWMVGYVQRNVSRIIRERRQLEIMDISTTILFILYILLFTTAAIQSHIEWKFILDINQWNYFERLHNGSQISNEYKQLKYRYENSFIIYKNKDSLEQNDIKIVSDVIFTLILVFCIVHLCFFLLISEYFGPLLVSLTIMTYQTSFLHLFSYYFHEEEYKYVYLNNTDSNRKLAQIIISYPNLKRLIINVFYTLFGIVQNELTKTYTNKSNIGFTDFINHTHDYYLLNSFTLTTGSFIYGSFAFGARIILITMIIAYIKLLYKLNKQQALNDWKLARATLFMKYISKDPDILPVPLNLIPTPKHLINLFRKKSVQKTTKQKTFTQENYLRSLNYISHEYNSKKTPTSEEVMNCIVLRFLTESYPFDIQSSKRTRQIQYKEELSNIRHHVSEEIQMIQQENQTLNKHISTVFFDLDKYE
ncbi:hypothetical protein I4U23_008317 [Adineta vaga]|nr:hypothetical protein I4U23_008317 [Adineta vaga]